MSGRYLFQQQTRTVLQIRKIRAHTKAPNANFFIREHRLLPSLRPHGVKRMKHQEQPITPETNPEPNVQQAVPFLMVSNMEASLRFYIDGLGFRRTKKWTVDNKIRWCWLEIGRAAVMLQEYGSGSPLTTAKLGEGLSICFQCKDALAIYHEALARGLAPRRPFVGN